MSTSVLTDTLPLVVVRPRTPRTSTARQSMSPSVQTFDRSASKASLWFQPLDNPCVRAFKQSAVRPPFGFNRSTIPVYERSSSRPFGLKGVRPLVSNRSTIHVYERSSSRPFSLKSVRPLVSTGRQSICTSVQAVGRSALKVFDLWFQPLVNPCVRAFKHTAVRPQRYSHFDLNRSTIHSHERSNIRPFDLKGSCPLGFNRSSIHGHERSSIRPFDAINVVHSASMTFGLTRSMKSVASSIRPHSFHSASHATRPLPSVASSIQLL
ncbi:hypothetical protein LR48_Vigan11g042800 [Vigna angularis]|uniref:Uncharacterized protein n=1 Tax=Phaseolus angularis TaxID=3914 RepID=A0A0L9VQQ4_PHAAN|nr:hypothetical protein LR48_Vigan11g042800 [Vigna angularis]